MDIRDLIEHEILPNIRQPLWESWFIKEKIGSGSFSVVYRIEAQRPGGTDESALKVEAITADGQLFSDDLRKSTFLNDKKEMAVNEAQIMKKLRDCPYIVRYEEEHMQELYVNGSFEGYYYLIRMELLESVYELMRTKKFDFSEPNIRKLASEIGQGLKAAHDNSVIHRDIKPENMFMSPKGTYKLGDFNISKKAESTRTFAGTQYYMAPEIFWANTNPELHYTVRADIYSLGLCLYQMMNSGALPFENECDPAEACTKRMKGEEFPPPANASPEFAAIIMKACAYDFNARYQSVGEMLNVLDHLPAFVSRQASAYARWTVDGRSTPVPAGTASEDDPPAPPREKKNRSGLIIVTVCLLLIALLIAGLVILALKWDEQNRGIADSSAAEAVSMIAAELTDPPVVTTVTVETIPVATIPPETVPLQTVPPETVPPVQAAPQIGAMRDVVANVRSSSQLGDITTNGKRHTYSVWNVLDGDRSTCWAEGADGLGEGEKIQLLFGGTYRVSSVTICNGLETKKDLFERNARVKSVTVAFSDGTSYEFSLNDGWDSAVSTFTLPAPVDTSYFELTVNSAYPGTKYADTCISEIELH